MNERNKTCSFTGHRDISGESVEHLTEKIMNMITQLYARGINHFLCGGALGFDTLCEQCVLAAKREHPDITLSLYLPCRGQDKMWSFTSKRLFAHIKSRADEVVYISEEYDSGCMFKRNRRLVDDSCVCICYVTHRGGGSAYTAAYALENKLEVINIADD